MSEARYAIYAAPRRDEALWRFGSGLLGYDAAKPGDVAAPDLAGITRADWHSLTAEPRRYGFHATLKAPFRLAGGQRESALQNALSDFCRRHQALPAFSLHVARLGPFFALIPKNANPGLQALAGYRVLEFFHLQMISLLFGAATLALAGRFLRRRRRGGVVADVAHEPISPWVGELGSAE